MFTKSAGPSLILLFKESRNAPADRSKVNTLRGVNWYIVNWYIVNWYIVNWYIVNWYVVSWYIVNWYIVIGT